MSDTDAHARFAEALNDLLRSRRIELPVIRSSAGRDAYLRFLNDRGYKEDEVLPVIQKDRVTSEMRGALLVALIQAVESDDKGVVKAVALMAHNVLLGRDNTNLIIDQLAATLTTDLETAGISVPSFYAGVFPTDSYNAQCARHDGQCIVLLDTGCVEMAEAVVVSFLSKAPMRQKVLDIANAVDNYVLHGQRADSGRVDSSGVSFGGGLPAALVTAFEEYMLAHELGHLALGHASNHHVRQHSPRFGQPFALIDKSEFQEFQADLWACRALVSCARSRRRSDSDLALAIGGMSMGLGVGLLVEASAKKHKIQLPPGHPPAHERLYMMEVAYEVFGGHEDAYIGRRFHEFLEEAVERYPDAELPPILARDLNQKMIPVLDSLGIEYSHAPFIREFT